MAMVRAGNQAATVGWILTLFFHWVPGLVIFLVSPRHSYARRQAGIMLVANAVFYSLGIAAFLLSFLKIGFLLSLAAGIWALYVCVKGAIDTHHGREYRPLVIGDLARGLFRD